FEAGTPNIAGTIGLAAAIDYVEAIGLDAIAAHENDLLDYATRRADEMSGLTLIGTARDRASILSFTLEGIHPHEIGTILDHHQKPRNFRSLADANRKAEGFNPLCGDRLTLYVKLKDGVIADASFEGSGCAISTASASLLTESIKGKTEHEAEMLFQGFR